MAILKDGLQLATCLKVLQLLFDHPTTVALQIYSYILFKSPSCIPSLNFCIFNVAIV